MKAVVLVQRKLGDTRRFSQVLWRALKDNLRYNPSQVLWNIAALKIYGSVREIFWTLALVLF